MSYRQLQFFRVYVDAVFNHMAASDAAQGNGVCGSFFSTVNGDFPAVPYGPWDFNDQSTCHTASGNIEDYSDAEQVIRTIHNRDYF